jgi:dolichol kinase
VNSAALRRALHAASTGVALLALRSPSSLLIGTGTLAAVAVVVEIIRLRAPRAGGWLAMRVPVYRPRERGRPSGALWLALGYAICALGPPHAAVAGILAGGLADPVGAAVGSRWGGGSSKSNVGSAAVAGVTFGAVMITGATWWVAIVAALAAGVVERWPAPFDDNLLVGPATALVTAALT